MFHCQGEEGFGRLCHAEFISASLTGAFGQRFRNEFGKTINHNKSRHPEQSEGSLTNGVWINPSPQSSPLGEEEVGGFGHAEFISAFLTERLGKFPSPREEGLGERVLSFAKVETLKRVQGDIIKKCAFTLAEVLITLGIIGVVAAITIPGLMTKYRHHVMETKLAKFDSIINQAVRMSIAENGDFTYEPPANSATNATYLKEWFDEYLLKYMKADYEGNVISNRYYKVNLLDGSGFVSYTPDSGTTIHFFFCINASDKSCKPESYDGKNTFVFDYSPDKRAVFPNGSNETNIQKLKYSNVSTSRGCYAKTNIHHHLCAQLIKLNGWKIPKDYPW